MPCIFPKMYKVELRSHACFWDGLARVQKKAKETENSLCWTWEGVTNR